MKEYIERGEQESILKKRYYELAGRRPDFYAGYMTAFHIIEDDIPNAADVVEVRHGRWDDSGRYKFPNGETAVCCTECGCALRKKEYENNNWFYCPVCGALMDKDTYHEDEPKSITRPELPEPETVTYGGYVEVTELLALPDEVLIPFFTDIQKLCSRLNSYNHFANRFLKEE